MLCVGFEHSCLSPFAWCARFVSLMFTMTTSKSATVVHVTVATIRTRVRFFFDNSKKCFSPLHFIVDDVLISSIVLFFCSLLAQPSRCSESSKPCCLVHELGRSLSRGTPRFRNPQQSKLPSKSRAGLILLAELRRQGRGAAGMLGWSWGMPWSEAARFKKVLGAKACGSVEVFWVEGRRV